MLDVRRMRVFREIARQGSIAGAARALSFTPSAVSQQVAKLEQEAGTALLERSPRSICLTEAGRILAEHAEVILERLALAEAEVRAGAPPSERILRVGSFPTAGATLLPAALAALARQHPTTEVTVAGLDPLVSLERVASGELDLGILFEYDRVDLPAPPMLQRDLLLEEAIHVVLPRTHPTASRRSVPLTELADEAWIRSQPASSCHPFTERTCRAAGFEPRIAFEFDDYQTMLNLVAAAAGIAFAPTLTLAATHPDVVLRPIAFRPPARRIYATWRADVDDPLVADAVSALHMATETLVSRQAASDAGFAG